MSYRPLFMMLFIMVTALTSVQAQEKHYLTSEVTQKDTLPVVNLAQVNIVTKRTFNSAYDEAVFNKLRRKVIEVYPYALMAREIYESIHQDLDSIDRKRKQKKYLKGREKVLRDQFEAKLKDLTRTEGRILVKLINRETGNNCFELVKELKNPLSAFFWQNFGKFYGYDLKENYDPEDKDKEIEFIVKSIEGNYPNHLPIQ